MRGIKDTMTLAEPTIRKWTKAEYHEAAGLGWFDRQRVELIDGEVVEMPPQKDEHAMGVRLCEDAVRRAFGEGFVYCVQMPLDLGPGSEPEPDVAVVRGMLRSVKKHPKTALLVIEVSDTTLAYDRGRKASLYASRGIRDYWIVNLIDHCLEVHRRPARDPKAPFGFTYADVRMYRDGEAVSPIATRRASIPIADLLP